MSAVKTWARSLLVLAVFSSGALFVVPRSMLRQAKFVIEMVLLLCVIVPVSFLPRVETSHAPWNQAATVPGDAEPFSIERFYARETETRVEEIARKLKIPLAGVSVSTGSGLRLSAITVLVETMPEEETLQAFRQSLISYMGIPAEKVIISLKDG